ncbi:aspartate aminotransferase family protein [Sporolactobacillus shoreicorticis]|uniref:Aspartate aminotransferase family protein n=1 Tax=Sporolactobacillus shoreicorticis TaxID=1923877 RepID=A0ABW5S2M0_9BACL|nr:aspartate aminotransferase family protein [Sporolactobacillus shoreicorticis]MCO7128158.1 aspartate aminotransferase family protein [Sporolactobacillus shoreicorticis]
MRLNGHPINNEKSKKIYNQSKKYLVNGVASSFHKAGFQDFPTCFDHGKGAYLYDVDGNKYIDYVAGMGPLILGYSPAAVNRAVSEQMAKGTQFCSPSADLNKLAEKLTEIIPCAERIAFQNTGTEANMFAFRLARAFTGKSKMIKFEGQYHGWSDEEMISTDARSVDELGPREQPSKNREVLGQLAGASDQVIILPWNDLTAVKAVIEKQRDEIAAIITEPYMCDSGPIFPNEGYLEELRTLATDHNILLIFDEVITGFRMSLGGAQAYFGVTPDVAVFAKAISGGLPLSVVAGKSHIMDCGIRTFGTFNGNALSVAAALATIDQLQQGGVYERFDALGQQLTDGLRKLGDRFGIPLYCRHDGAICMLLLGVDRPVDDFRDYLRFADIERYNYLVARSLELGLRLTPNRGRIYLSTQHSEADIQKTLLIIENIFSEWQ